MTEFFRLAVWPPFFWLSDFGRAESRSSLRIVGWLREVAPSTELCRWFGHDPAKWNEFRRRYFVELDTHREALQPLRDAEKQGRVTLV